MLDLLQKLIRYVFTGGTAAIVDIGGFVLLTNAGLALLPAGVISFVAAAIVNYLLTSRFVFASKAQVNGFFLFFAAAVLGLVVNVSVTLLAASQAGLSPGLAKTTGVAVAFLINFALNVAVVFRRKG